MWICWSPATGSVTPRRQRHVAPERTTELLDDWQDDRAGQCSPKQRYLMSRHAGIIFRLIRRIAAIGRGAGAAEVVDQVGQTDLV